MTSKHAELLLEKYLIGDETEYFIDENYLEFYKDNLMLSEENENLIKNVFGAKIHNISQIESKDYMPITTIRTHITFKDKLYCFLAISTPDVENVVLYETPEITSGLCYINHLPEKELLKRISL